MKKVACLGQVGSCVAMVSWSFSSQRSENNRSYTPGHDPSTAHPTLNKLFDKMAGSRHDGMPLHPSLLTLQSLWNRTNRSSLSLDYGSVFMEQLWLASPIIFQKAPRERERADLHLVKSNNAVKVNDGALISGGKWSARYGLRLQVLL